MATVSERARLVAEEMIGRLMESPTLTYFDGFIHAADKALIPLIEQALLAERRLAKLEAAEIAQNEPRCWDANAPDPQTRIAAKLRAAAEKEVQNG